MAYNLNRRYPATQDSPGVVLDSCPNDSSDPLGERDARGVFLSYKFLVFLLNQLRASVREGKIRFFVPILSERADAWKAAGEW